MRTFIKTIFLPVLLPFAICMFFGVKIVHLIVFIFDDTYDKDAAEEVFCFHWGLLPKYLQKD